MEIRFAVPVTVKQTNDKHRYFVDLKQGAFIYVFPEGYQVPEGWPLVELPRQTVEDLLLKEEE